MLACTPAPASTTISCLPLADSFLTVSGVAATRVSPGRVSRGMPMISAMAPWRTASEIRSIVRGENDCHAALLGLTVPGGTLSASCLAWQPFSSAPLSSELLTQYTIVRLVLWRLSCHKSRANPARLSYRLRDRLAEG